MSWLSFQWLDSEPSWWLWGLSPRRNINASRQMSINCPFKTDKAFMMIWWAISRVNSTLLELLQCWTGFKTRCLRPFEIWSGLTSKSGCWLAINWKLLKILQRVATSFREGSKSWNIVSPRGQPRECFLQWQISVFRQKSSTGWAPGCL